MTFPRRENATGQGRVVETSIQNSKHENRTRYRGQAQDPQANRHNILAVHYCYCHPGLICTFCLTWNHLISRIESREVALVSAAIEQHLPAQQYNLQIIAESNEREYLTQCATPLPQGPQGGQPHA